MDITTFLQNCAVAREAGGPAGPPAGTALATWQQQRRELLWRDWGLEHRRDERESAPRWVVTGSVDQGTHVIDRGWYEASPGLVVTANLYRPHPDRSSGAGMIYLCGHSPSQKVQYQDHARRFAQLGFTTLIIDTVQRGEIPGLHHGMFSHGTFNWVSRGYSPAAAEGWTAVRGYDLLAGLAEVDPDRIGITGHSGGGAVSWWAAALEPRIRAVVSSTGTAGEASHLVHRTIDIHCDCYFPVNPQAEPIASVYALVAPRPTLVLAPRFDQYCEYESVVAVTDRLADWYAAQTGEQWPLQVFGFDAEHTYTQASRRRAFGWMTTHVREPAPTGPTADVHRADATTALPADIEQPDDIDGVRLPVEQLVVFGAESPPAAANSTLQDWLTPPRATALLDPEQLAAEIINTCFRFASWQADTAARVARRSRRGDIEIFDLSYEPEPSWPLEAILRRPMGTTAKSGTTVHLLDRASPRPFATPAAALGGSDSASLTLAVRGTGRTTWHPQADWHIRRTAAMLGRPVGAMRVLDTVRGLQAHRELFGTGPLTLIARREVAFPALLAALLDPQVTKLHLSGLPPSLDITDTEAEQQEADGSCWTPQPEISLMLRIADVDDILRAVRTRAVVELD